MVKWKRPIFNETNTSETFFSIKQEATNAKRRSAHFVLRPRSFAWNEPHPYKRVLHIQLYSLFKFLFFCCARPVSLK